MPVLADAGEETLVDLAVVGAHLTGMPLNHQLTGRGAVLTETTRTAADYRLYALPGTVPPKPGLAREPGYSGNGLEVEVWRLTREAFGAFTEEVPAPLAIGSLTLRDGRTVKGFVCEPAALAGAEEITAFGGWRAYMATPLRVTPGSPLPGAAPLPQGRPIVRLAGRHVRPFDQRRGNRPI